MIILSIKTKGQYKGLVNIKEIPDKLSYTFLFKIHLGDIPNIQKIECEEHEFAIFYLSDKAEILESFKFTGVLYVPEYKVDDNHYINIRAMETKPIKIRGEKEYDRF